MIRNRKILKVSKLHLKCDSNMTVRWKINGEIIGAKEQQTGAVRKKTGWSFPTQKTQGPENTERF